VTFSSAQNLVLTLTNELDTTVTQGARGGATSQKVAGSIPDGVN